MTHRQIKGGYLIIQWLNSVGTSFYIYYLFFLMEREFGFGNFGNLGVCATYGLRRLAATPRRGRNANVAARNAASAKRKAIRAEVVSQLAKLAGERPVASGPNNSPKIEFPPSLERGFGIDAAGEAEGVAMLVDPGRSRRR